MLEVFTAAPTPVSTAQPIRAATPRSRSSSTATTLDSGTTVCSAKVPAASIWWTGLPPELNRGVPSRSPPEASTTLEVSHRWGWALSQKKQLRH